ncbi:MAG TPA: glycerol-3-phosphate dehydrogenase C-terminal domain-containing protein, partial [Gemmatimonadaceae bacterium]|nr:glycerol-3-phosphate dehydrogenase C-terminal domain-containing protein [Gemmatimonadaceae bacterium]
LPTHDAVTLISPIDGRVLFALPAGELTIVGTTDHYTRQSADTVCASEREVAYLLEAANYFFPGCALGRDDVVAAWAGIRPLAVTKQSSVTASREHSIATSPSGVVTVTGGKLTTARRMAADVVDHALEHLGRPVRRTPTANTPLPGGDLESVARAESEATAVLGDPALARHLVAAHGSAWRVVAGDIQRGDDGGQRLHPAFPYTLGEVRYSIRSELACTLGDILIRRTRLAFETPDHAGSAVPRVARTMATLLGWSDARRQAEMTAFDEEIRRIFSIEASQPSDDATPAGLAPGATPFRESSSARPPRDSAPPPAT